MSERIEMNESDVESAAMFADRVVESFDEKPADYSGDGEWDSIAKITKDIEHFTRTWVGRIRRLIHRSAQVIERESLLAAAITRLNQQQAEWTRRTEAKEQALQEQTQLLTEGWLEVEAERRKAFQGGRSSTKGSKKRTAAHIISSAAQPGQTPTLMPIPSDSDHSNSASPVVSNPSPNPSPTQPNENSEWLAHDRPGEESNTPSSVNQVPTTQSSSRVNPAVSPGPAKAPPLQPVVPKGKKPMAPAPVAPAPVTNTPPNTEDPDSIQAQAKDRLEEFKRMQRALRANRNN